MGKCGVSDVLMSNLRKKDRNAMGAAIGTTALNAAMTPAAIAAADPSFLSSVDIATAQIATASIITLFLCPFLTAYLDKRIRRKKISKIQEELVGVESISS